MALPETTNSTYGPGPHTADHDVIHDILNIITEQGAAGQVLAKTSSVNPESGSGARLGYISLPEISGFVSRSGDSMTGILAMSNNRITGLGTPTAATDAATKGYIDGHAGIAAGAVRSITHSTSGPLATLNASLGHTIIVTLSADVTGFGAWTSWAAGQFATIWFVNPSSASVSRSVNLSSFNALPGQSAGTVTLAPGAVYMITVTSHSWSTRRYLFSGLFLEGGA